MMIYFPEFHVVFHRAPLKESLTSIEFSNLVTFSKAGTSFWDGWVVYFDALFFQSEASMERYTG